MKKNIKHSQHSVVFHERPLVVAVRHALPYIVGLSLAFSTVQHASSRSSESAAAFTATQLVRQFTLKNTVSQVSLGMQGYVVDVNGQQLGPAMGTAPSGWPADMGSVPTTVNLPRRDGAGRPLGYCAWDNSSTTPMTGYNVNDPDHPDLVYAVVSPGLNGTMQTSCAYILANGVGVGDDHVQVTAPIQISSVQYKSSVATFADLPAGKEGDVRLVRDTNKLYSYVGGTWGPIDGSKFSDDSATNGVGAIAYTTGKVTVADFQATTATFSGGVTANTFTGNGGGLTDLNAANFSSGVMAPQFGGTGVNASAAANGTLLIGNGSGFTLGTLTAGAGISVLNDAGAITISNSGVISITGTADQIITSANNGNVVLSLPQNIATNSIPTFGGMMLNGDLMGTNATFNGTVTMGSLAAQRLDVGTSAGGVTNPNLIIGIGAMPGAQSGNGGNSVLGVFALNANTSGELNTATGLSALRLNSTGSFNTANGFQSLLNNSTGYSNSAFGINSLVNTTTGFENAALGSSSGMANTTGSNNTFLGASADATSGALTFATAIGSNSRVATSNTMALGRNSVTDQIVIGTDTRNDTFVGTKLYVNGVTNLNGDLRGTTATFTGAVTANSFVGDGSGLTNLNASNFNSGILPVAQGGTGLDGSAAPNGSLLIGNGTGYTLNTLTGTADQINVTNGAGTITLSLPQSIATTSSPTFGGMVLNGNLAGTTATFGGAVTVDSLAAQRLNVGTTAGGVTNPNLIIGNGAMPGAQTGNGNNAVVGISALNQNTSGQRNTAVGNQALYANTTGSNNTANGFAALFSNTTGLTNVAIGNVALYGNTTGNNNVAVGNGAGYSTLGGVTTNANTTGGANTFLGSNAMPGTATPLFNATALGAEATVSTSNTLALGRNSVTDQIVIGTDTRNDTFAGTKLYVNGVTNLNGDLRGTTATFTGAVSANSFAGDGSGLTNLNASNFNSGILPVAQGGTGLDGSAAANGSLLIGNGTGYTLGTLTGTANQVNVTNGAGTITLSLPQNIATTSTPTFGGLTLNGAITGTTGTFSGAVTVDSLAAQRLNVGTLAGVSGRNLIIGINAMPSVQTGAGLNVAVGLDALGMNSSGNRNTAVGNFALFSNTTGLQNTASGVGALYSNTTGNNNVAVGRSAGYASQFGNTVNANITGGFNTFLGSFARPGSTDQLNYATALGSEATVSTSNTLALGRNSVTDQIVIGTDTRNDTFAGTKLYVNGVTNLNGDLRGTTATFTGAVSANSFAGDGSGLTNLNASNFNSGILPVAQGGTGLDGSAAANGSLLIGNGTGYTLNTLTGTANQVNVTNGAGTIILSLPQSIATTSSPTFGGMVLNGNLAGTTGTFTGAVTVDSLSAQRLNVGTSAGGVNRPNVIIGNTAMAGAQSGDGANTAVGINVLNANTTGSDNTGVGHGALQVNTAGAGNTAIGSNGLRLNTTGNGNTATGVNALAFSTTGSSNTAYGNGSLSANTTGSRNSAVGLRAGLANTTGSDNTFLGYQADTTSNALTFATVIGSGSTVATSNTMALGRNSVTDQIVIGTDTRNDTFAGTKLYVNGVTNLNGDLRGTTATFTGAVSANSFAGDGSGLTNLNASNFTTGILPVARGGTGLDGSAAANGSLLIGNGTGYTLNTLTGTANQINVTNGAGTITLSLPQSIATTSTPTFGGMTLNGALSGTTGAFSSSATVGGTLAVTGATTLTGAVTANSIINANAGLSVTTGEFIRFGGQTENTDTMTFSRFNVATDQSMLRLSFGDNNGGFNSSSGDEFQVGYTSGGVFTPALRVSGIGDVIVGRNITAGGSLTATGGTFTGAVTVDSLGAQRLNLGTSAGGVTDINLIIGNGAMPGAQSGGGANIAVGLNALAANTSGQWNTAIGRTALTRNTTGSDNIAIGPYALFNNTTGYSNIATGAQALTSNTTGFQNTASGMNSLYNTTTGSSNTASGDNTLFANTTGSNNVALGRSAGNTNTTGNDNTFLGYNANATSSALSFASAIGSGSTVATSNTMALGRNSVTDQIVIGTDTRNDTFAGTKLYVNGVTNLNGALRGTTANFTGRVDAASLFVNGVEVTGGGSVTRAAIQTALEGNFNIALGTGSLQNGSFTGANNTVFGVGAAALTTGTSEQNVVIGRLAGQLLGRFTAADGNTLVGYQAGYQIQAASGGDYNTLIGHNSDGGSDITYGTALGAATSVTGASYSTAIGAGASATSSSMIALGRNSTADQVVIGSNARNDTFAGTKLYVNGTTFLNGDLRGTTATFTGAVAANSFVGNGSGLTNLDAADFTTGTLAVARGGTGLSATPTNGQLLIGNGTGYTLGTLTGTANQVNVTNGAGTITLSLPQSIATTSTPTFGGLALSGNLTGTTATFTGAVTVDSLSALRLNVGTSTGPVTNPNLIIGNGAMPGAQNGFGGNTAVGINTLAANTSGVFNSALGSRALTANTIGNYNSAFGNEALKANLDGNSNSAFGDTALLVNTSGARNAAVGTGALDSNTLGSDNVGLGFLALDANTTGSRNSAIGRSAGSANTVGNDNTFLGYQADATVNNLSFATAIGAGSTVGDNNTIVLGRNGSPDQVVIGTAFRNDTAVGTKLYVNGVTRLNGRVHGSTATFTGAVTVDSLVTGGVSASGRIFTNGGMELPTGQTLRFGADDEGSDTQTITRFNDGFNKARLRISLGDDVAGFGQTSTDEFQIGYTDTSGVYQWRFLVAGSGDVRATSFATTSDRRLKTNIDQLDTDTMLDKLGQIGAYRYNLIAIPGADKKIGVMAQELETLFPEVATYGSDNFLAVDYGALGAMAAVGVGQLNTKFKALDVKVNEQGTKILALEDVTGQHSTKIAALESWKTEAVGRMDTMQTAIDLNIQKIADHAVAIQTNAKAIERLDDALITLDDKVKGNTNAIDLINQRWARNFSESADGSLLTVTATELKVSNFTAQQMRANSVYTQRLEAEMARIADLEVNNLRANTAVANTVQAEQVNTGSVQVYAGVGMPAMLFAAKADGHYTVSTSSLDGSYATATVIVNAGQAKVVSGASEGIELVAEGNMVKAIAAGKSIKASWIKMG